MATAKIARLPRSAAPLRRPFSNQDEYIEILSGQETFDPSDRCQP